MPIGTWEDSSDGDHQDKIKVDLEKGRVTHERIAKEGYPHEHEWSDTRPDSISYGWRGTNYKEDESNDEDESEDEDSDDDDDDDNE